jgi:hypothetical protein
MKATGLRWRLVNGDVLVQVACLASRASGPCVGVNIASERDGVVRCWSCGAEEPLAFVDDADKPTREMKS